MMEETKVRMVTDGDEKVSKVYKTFEYEKFKRLKGNREVKPTSKLRQSIEEFGMINPIAITPEGFVVDGQHRLQIAKELSLPVFYVVILVDLNSDAIDAVREFNISRPWAIKDYINKYAELGVEDYIRLRDLVMGDYKYPVANIISMGLGIRALSVMGYAGVAESGKFRFYDYEGVLTFLNTYDDFVKSADLKPSRYLMTSLFYLYTLKSFDYKTLLKKVKKQNTKEVINDLASSSVISEHLISAYNKGNSKNPINFAYDNNKNIYTIGEVNKELVNSIR